MLAQYLVSLGAANLRISKARCIKAANSPYGKKEKPFNGHLLVESFCIVFQKYFLRQGSRLSLAFNLVLISTKFQACVLVELKRVYFTR